MTLVIIRGKAMTWYYYCKKCKLRLFKIEDRLKAPCLVCRKNVKMPKEMVLCNACSYETGMCMGCGNPIKILDDHKTMMEKDLTGEIKGRRRKKTQKKNKKV